MIRKNPYEPYLLLRRQGAGRCTDLEKCREEWRREVPELLYGSVSDPGDLEVSDTRAKSLLHDPHGDLSRTESRQPHIARRFLKPFVDGGVHPISRYADGQSAL